MGEVETKEDFQVKVSTTFQSVSVVRHGGRDLVDILTLSTVLLLGSDVSRVHLLPRSRRTPSYGLFLFTFILFTKMGCGVVKAVTGIKSKHKPMSFSSILDTVVYDRQFMF